MDIAVLSGKGGTGKTTVAVNLAQFLQAGYIDCDVEEPNGFIFLKPEEIQSRDVMVTYPAVDKDRCNLCGSCVGVCQFNALFNTRKEILVLEKMCHGCEACSLVCRRGAISFQQRVTGSIEKGQSKGINCQRGILNVGEPMAVPVIRELLKDSDSAERFYLLDCSPGTSCNAVNTLRYSQGAVLVTEPSAFGLHDLKMAIELVRNFHIPFGIVINKWNAEGELLQEFLEEENVTILGYIPMDRKAAEFYSQGRMLSEIPFYQEIFSNIAHRVKEVFQCS